MAHTPVREMGDGRGGIHTEREKEREREKREGGGGGEEGSKGGKSGVLPVGLS